MACVVLAENQVLQVAVFVDDWKLVDFAFPDKVVGFVKRDVALACDQVL